MAEWLERVFNAASRLSRVAVWLSGALLLSTAGWVGVEVLVRKFLGISTQGATEVSSYVLAVCTAWSLTYTLLRKGHVRVDVVAARLPLKGRAALHLLALVVLAVFSIPLAYFGWGVAWASFVHRTAANTALGTPLWIPQGLWMAGLAVFSLVVVLLAIKVVGLVLHGDYAAVERVAGLPGTEEPSEAGAPTTGAALPDTALREGTGLVPATAAPDRKEPRL